MPRGWLVKAKGVEQVKQDTESSGLHCLVVNLAHLIHNNNNNNNNIIVAISSFLFRFCQLVWYSVVYLYKERQVFAGQRDVQQAG